MKKKIFVIAIAILNIIILYSFISCTKNSTTNKITTNYLYDIETNNSKLLSDLREYNLETSKNIQSTKASDDWFKFCAVIGADYLASYEGCLKGARLGLMLGSAIGHPAHGAIVGGILMGGICGVGASYATYKGVTGCSIVSNSILYDHLYNSMTDNYHQLEDIRNSHLILTPIADSLLLPDLAITMGALHNEMLSDLNNSGPNNITKGNNLNTDFTDIGEFTSVESYIFSNEEFCQNCKDNLSYVTETDTFLAENTLSDKVMQLYNDLISASYVEEEELVDYINSYYLIVERSDELTQEEKNCIYTGLAVSLFSYDYWKECYAVEN